MNTDVIRKLVEDRLEELDKERADLEQALAELGGRRSGGTSGNSGGGRKGRRKGGSSRSRSESPSSSSSAQRPGRRRRKGGTRSEHAERAVADNPGIKASEIAEQLKIKPNYVYRVMGDLLKEGRVTKKGMGYYVAEADPKDSDENAAAA